MARKGKPSFRARLVPEIPPLAWLCTVSAGTASLHHGSSVHVREDGFFEGCFAGPLEGDLTEASEVFGSGLRIRADGTCRFVTPSHSLEALFAYRHADGWTVANSLPFLLERHGLVLPWKRSWARKLGSIARGIVAYERKLFDAPGGGAVYRFCVEDLVLGSGGGATDDEAAGPATASKRPPPRFPSYASYVDYLVGTLRAVFENARSAGRSATYAPLATCSSGYDSAASAALSRRLGCEEAVTLRVARGGRADSGLEVGRALGLCVTELERTERVEGPLADVAEFFAGGMSGEDYCFRAFEPSLRRRVLLTGFLGGMVWDVHMRPNPALVKEDLSGTSLQELRLRTDFVHVPVPSIGYRGHADIRAISRSAEMEPYRLGTGYDRPIPRRILEESGVPRGLFAQRKKAASLQFFAAAAAPTLSPEARGEVAGLLRRIGFLRRLSYRAGIGSFKVRATAHRALSRLARFSPSAVKRLARASIAWRLYQPGHPRSVPLFLLSVDHVRARYAAAR